jgi:hypothetical protein
VNIAKIPRASDNQRLFIKGRTQSYFNKSNS